MLIIYAHPHKKGHNGLILKTVTEILKKKEIKFEIIDLYQAKFNPLLKAEEVDDHGASTAQVKEYQSRLSQTDKLIIIYPNWWNSCPAILKGFLDRVFAAGFAFKYINGIPKPLLSAQALVFNTSGAPWLYQKFIAGNRALKVVIKDTLRFCGIKAKGVLFGSCRHLNQNKKKITSKVEQELEKFINS